MKAAELTKEKYLKYKQTGYTDQQIANLHGINSETLRLRKHDWKLIGKLKSQKQIQQDRKMEKFMSLYNKGWTDEAIAESLSIPRSTLSRWKRQRYPDLAHKRDKVGLTKKELKQAKKIGLSQSTVYARIRNGWDKAEALMKKAYEKR